LRPEDSPSKTRRWVVFVVFALAYFLSYFFRSSNAIIAPDLSREFQLAASDLGLMSGLFFGAFAAVQWPLGIALDTVGPRRVIPALMLVAAAGSLVFASARSFGMLAAGRGMIGIGMAGILTGALKAFSPWYPDDSFSATSGLLIAIGASGALVGTSPLAWLNQTFGWRQVFAWGALVVALSGITIVVGTPDTPAGKGWPSSAIRERGPIQLLREIRFWRIAILAFFMGGTHLAIQGLWAGPYLFDVLRLQPPAAGSTLLFMSVGVIAGYASSGWLAGRFGVERLIITSATIFVISLAALAQTVPSALVKGIFFIFGFSGAPNVMLLVHARLLFPSWATGRAVAGVNFFIISGAFVLQWLLGVLIGAFPTDSSGAYPAHAYAVALAFCALSIFVAKLWYTPLARGAPTIMDHTPQR